LSTVKKTAAQIAAEKKAAAAAAKKKADDAAKAAAKKKADDAAKAAAKKKADDAAAVNAYLATNFSLTDNLLSLDTTDPTKGFTLREALSQIQSEGLAANSIGFKRAADILSKTDWFQTHGVATTERIVQEKNSPGVFKQSVADTKTDVLAQANSMGFQLSDEQASQIARDAYIYGNAYNSNKIIQRIATLGKVGSGQALDNVDALRAYGSDMGISHDDSWYTTAAQSVAQNQSNLNDWKRQITDVAKSKYVSYADQIDKGMTVSQIASPYINSMASIFEVPSSSIDLTDGTINRALTNLDPSGKPQAQPLWQFEQGLKQDNRYFKTNQAKQSFLDLANNIATTFGKA